MINNIFKRAVTVAIIALFIGASITITPNTFVKTAKAEPETLFSDDFNDNMKDYSKWTEIYTSGTWWETNQRTEFQCYESGVSSSRYEGIESSAFTVSLSPTVSVNINWDVITKIAGTTSSVGQPRVRVTDGNNWIEATYDRFYDRTKYRDSTYPPGEVWTILKTGKGDGSWSNKIEIFSDRYYVTMDNVGSGPVYKTIFSSNPTLKIQIFIVIGGSNSPLYLRSGFDNIVVQGQGGENQPPQLLVITYETAEVCEPLPLLASSSDPDLDEISFIVYWGDGSNTGWTDYQITPTHTFFHTYLKIGTKEIHVIAKDEHDNMAEVFVNIYVGYTGLEPYHTPKMEYCYHMLTTKQYDATWRLIDRFYTYYYGQDLSAQYIGACPNFNTGRWTLSFLVDTELIVTEPPDDLWGTSRGKIRIEVYPSNPLMDVDFFREEGRNVKDLKNKQNDDHWANAGLSVLAMAIDGIFYLGDIGFPIAGIVLTAAQVANALFPPKNKNTPPHFEWELLEDITSASGAAWVDIEIDPYKMTEKEWQLEFNCGGYLIDGDEYSIIKLGRNVVERIVDGILYRNLIYEWLSLDNDGIIFHGPMPPDARTLSQKERNEFKIKIYCPIDVSVYTPYGGYINKSCTNINNATYEEIDLDGDGELDKEIYMPWGYFGNYSIYVNPYEDADPDDTFSIIVESEGENITLVEDMKISEINTSVPFIYNKPMPPWEIDLKGPTKGVSGVEYDYKLSAVDPYKLGIYEVLIDWGDDSPNQLVNGTFEPGETITVGHIWEEPGNYIIKFKAQDRLGIVSEWSETVQIDSNYDLEVSIDIKPGSYPNSINPMSNGNIPVAILNTEDFDMNDVNPSTVEFLGATPCKKEKLEDVDGDGDIDMLFHFKTQECDFSLLVDEGDDYPYAYLTGETIDGQLFMGKDTVRLVPPQQKNQEIDRPFLQFLQNFLQDHPVLLLILQKIIQRLEL